MPATSVLSAHRSKHWADSYALGTRDVDNALLLLDGTCAGYLNDTTPPAVRYIARLSTSLGAKLVLPMETWLQEGPFFRTVLHWDALLPISTHTPSVDLIWGIRTYAGNVESLSFWMRDRPLTFVGPGARFATALLGFFLLTLTSMRASANAFGLTHISGSSFSMAWVLSRECFRLRNRTRAQGAIQFRIPKQWCQTAMGT